jgi:preprotein translocase subunit SecD
MVVAAALLVGLLSSTFVSNLQAAIRFEVRLAEVNPAAGLHKALESGSDHPIYLHNEVVVTNSDIAAARVVPGSEASQFDISLEFTDSGAKKMLGATANHLGRPMAILLDGRVVMAPLLRSPIEKSAMITGNFSKTQAERIVRGIEIH